jgi:hypothetical protein
VFGSALRPCRRCSKSTGWAHPAEAGAGRRIPPRPRMHCGRYRWLRAVFDRAARATSYGWSCSRAGGRAGSVERTDARRDTDPKPLWDAAKNANARPTGSDPFSAVHPRETCHGRFSCGKIRSALDSGSDVPLPWCVTRFLVIRNEGPASGSVHPMALGHSHCCHPVQDLAADS